MITPGKVILISDYDYYIRLYLYISILHLDIEINFTQQPFHLGATIFCVKVIIAFILLYIIDARKPLFLSN